MDYPIKVPVVEFAQLSLDVYESKQDNDLRASGFNKDWVKIHSWTSPNQFHASFYKNHLTNVGVMAIRGTSTMPEALADGAFGVGLFGPKNMIQIKDAFEYFSFLEGNIFWRGTKGKYVCGHSLGGMLAKAIAPITTLNTIAFNSPGMNKFLIDNHYKVTFDNPSTQKQITYSATKDIIGNITNIYDNGTYVLINSFEEKDVKQSTFNVLPYHGIRLLYENIRDGEHKNDYF